MLFAKIFGWILLLTGLAVIAYSLYSSYAIFISKEPAPEIFRVEEKRVSPSSENTEGPQAQIEQMLQEQMKGMLGQMAPLNSIPQLLNLINWSMLAGILIFGGGKIAGLGIRLIKK